MRIALCDDERAASERLLADLQEYFSEKPEAEVEFSLYKSGQELLDGGSFDLVFLDVEMPGLSGIDAGALLMAQNPACKIFIVTSYPDYLDDAMRFHVFRYLSKPVDKARLFRNLNDALHQLSTERRMVTIETDGGVVTLSCEELVLLETQGHGTKITTINGVLTSAKSIRHWEKELGAGFLSPYRGILLHLKYVRSFTDETVTLRLPDGRELSSYLSRRRSKEFRQSYLRYLEAMR